MSVAALTALLERRHGLRFDELTAGRLQLALEEDAAAAGDTAAAQARRVIEDPARQQRIIDRVTLQETAFFRDGPVWADLAALVLPAAIRAAAGGPLVVWSAGCANGQEAWSLAMLLSELGAPRFEVVASDVSRAATDRAAAGVYEERELRGLDAARRARFFERDRGARWRVAASLRPHVRVEHHNVATARAPIDDGTCALVLCRYVLIYLTPDAAGDLLERLAAALEPQGHLVIGAAEGLWHLSEQFTPEALPHTVAYRARRATDAAGPLEVLRRAAAHVEQQRPPSRHEPPARPEPAPPPARLTAPTTPRAETGPRAVPSPGAPDGAALRRQGELAAARDDLAAAAAAFRGAAHLDPDDVAARVQLGLVLDALDDPGARHAFAAARTALARQSDDALASLGPSAAGAIARLLVGKLGEAP